MSTQDEIQTAIRQFVLNQFPAARKRGVADSDSLLEQGIVDSMGVLEIVTFIESEFDITLTDDELMSDHFETVASISDLIHRKTMEGATWTS
jgi:acyl carrier protein